MAGTGPTAAQKRRAEAYFAEANGLPAKGRRRYGMGKRCSYPRRPKDCMIKAANGALERTGAVFGGPSLAGRLLPCGNRVPD